MEAGQGCWADHHHRDKQKVRKINRMDSCVDGLKGERHALQWEPETRMNSIKRASNIAITNQRQETGSEGERGLND